ncbi:MAG: hypothetical protein KAV00_08215 [Phycisphaerae bacterium]|nr:hypothetical protein [Phycisphaerae bacterium]
MNSSEKHIDEEQMPESVRKILAHKKRRKRITLAAMCAIPFVLFGWWLWSNSAGDRAIQAEIDRYVAAGQPIYPADFNLPPTPDDNNAALTLKNAAAALVLSIEDSTFDFEKHSGTPKRIAKYHDEFSQIIKTNSEVLMLIRQARSMTGADWDVQMQNPMFHVTIPGIGSQRDVVRFLCSTAIYYHQADNDAEAVEVLRDAMAAARTMHKVPFLIGHLIAVAENALACSVIENIVVDLKVLPAGTSVASSKSAGRKQVRALISELLDEEELRKDVRLAYYSERAYVFDFAMLVLDGKMSLSLGGVGTSTWEKAKVGALKPALKKDVIRMLRYMTAQVEAAGQTNWPAVKEKMPEFPKPVGIWNRLTHMFSNMLTSPLNRAMELDFEVRAMRRMSAVALAIRLYEIDNGSRPAKLADLVPKYIPAVPDDPFDNPGQPLRYLPNAQQPILYSIGSNGEDQGGQYAGDPEDTDYSRQHDGYDLPFFLNGDRPRYEEDESETRPPTSQPGRRGRRKRKSDPLPSTMPR